MRLFVTSDLHYGSRRSGDLASARLAQATADRARRDDFLVLCGDLGDDDEQVASCLALFDRFPGRRLAIAGNHDIWVNPGESSWARYRGLSEVFRRASFHALEDAPIVASGIGFVGALGWYDYSFRDDTLGYATSCYETKTLPGMSTPLWRDAQRASWGMPDADVARWQAARLTKHLRALGPSARRIIALTHHLPIKRLLVHPRALVPPIFRFANAFLGSRLLGDAVLSDARVQLVVSGHVHLGRECNEGGTRFLTVGGDYHDKELLVIDPLRVTYERERYTATDGPLPPAPPRRRRAHAAAQQSDPSRAT
jgi:3',5'-cyclic AMP phosphodiesterase CpdA